VLIGVGQHLHREGGIHPAALMAEAIRNATSDAGLAGVPAVDALRVVSLLSWKYGNPAWVVAQELGIEPRELAVTTNGGNSPQSLVNLTAGQIQRGELDIAILTGGESWRTRGRARKSGNDVEWPKAPDGIEPIRLGEDLVMNHQHEIDRRIVMPVQVYPMFETAIRAAAGRSPADHLLRISELWARFSEVAADNPYAWSRTPLTAEQIRTAGPDNRMIGSPYPKYMNSNNDVDMAAALIICSAATAASLGVATDRWVFVHSGSDCHEHQYISNRWAFSETPAVQRGGQQALQLAGIGIDDVSVVDLYSCFPSAVQLGAHSLGLSIDGQLTRTGGLQFAGGPWNNYVMHAIATVVADLRNRPGERGLVWANGGYTTKHAFGVYSTTPPTQGFRHAYPQDEIDAMPRRDLATGDSAAGPATIEAYTVMHARDGGPEQAIAACLLADGRRAWGTSTDGDTAQALAGDAEWVDTAVTLDAAGALHLV
jgi:acetyl-CoA C-acetyltransferase